MGGTTGWQGRPRPAPRRALRRKPWRARNPAAPSPAAPEVPAWADDTESMFGQVPRSAPRACRTPGADRHGSQPHEAQSARARPDPTAVRCTADLPRRGMCWIHPQLSAKGSNQSLGWRFAKRAMRSSSPSGSSAPSIEGSNKMRTSWSVKSRSRIASKSLSACP